MNDFYPEESKNMDAVGHLEELRRRLFICLGAFAAASGILFLFGDYLLRLVKMPLGDFGDRLVFIGPTEAFMAYFKVVLLSGFILSFPMILYQVWAFFSPAVPRHVRKHIVAWLVLALGLFAGGILFSYWVAIPTALRFLLNFGKDIAVPNLTLGKYISFFGALILIGGVIFEIPVSLALLTEVGLVRSEILRAKRHYALIGMLIAAALLTPTQDVVNMLLFALPMILLYEIGIIISQKIERDRKKRVSIGSS